MTPQRRRQLWYVPLLVLAMALMMLRLLVMAQVLSVPGFAAFSGGLLVSGTFCMLGCLGLQSLLQREWPLQLLRGRERRGTVRAAQCMLVALACAVPGLLAAACGLEFAGLAPGLLAAGLLHGLSQQFFLVATVESRSRGDMLRYARQNLLRAAVALTASAAVAAASGSAAFVLVADAVLTAALALRSSVVSVALARTQLPVVYRLAWRRLRAVPWRSALQLAGVMVVSFAVLNVDRWVASSTLPAAGFAHYAFAWTLLSVAHSSQAVVNAAFFPLVARRFGSVGREPAFRLCVRMSLLVLAAGTVLALPLGLGAGWAIRLWYPLYADALPLLPLFLGVAVVRLADFWTSFLLIAGLEAHLLVLNLASLVVGAGLWLAASDLAGTPLQVAWLAAALTLSNAALAMAAAWRARHEPPAGRTRAW